MDRTQAENRARGLNAGAHHPMISYVAYPMAPTRWEKDRWGVLQLFGNGDIRDESTLVGIAAT